MTPHLGKHDFLVNYYHRLLFWTESTFTIMRAECKQYQLPISLHGFKTSLDNSL